MPTLIRHLPFLAARLGNKLPQFIFPRLAGFYFAYFAVLGISIPYWGLYLESLGLSARAIGILIAISLATRLFAPYFWGALADRSGKRIHIIRFACVAALVTYAGVFPAGASFWALAAVMLAFAFFWDAALPQFEAVTLNHLKDNTHHYSRIRLWGSLGFILTSIFAGMAIEYWGVGIMPVLMMVFLLLMGLIGFSVPEEGRVSPSSVPRIMAILKQPPVIALLIVCFLVQLSHGPYYAFFSIYLKDHDYSSKLIGLLWALSVVAEIVVFLFMHRLLPKYGTRLLMQLTLALTALRWVLIAFFVDSLGILIFAQILHALSFGMYHAIAIHLIHQHFPGSLQGRGQALYSSASFGAGGALGSVGAGFLWQGFGPQVTFSLAAASAILALAAASVGFVKPAS